MTEQRHAIAMAANCTTCGVRDGSPCGTLAADELEALAMIGRRRRLGRGQSLMWEGDESPAVANVVEGVLKLTCADEEGREQIVGMAWPSDMVGSLFSDQSCVTATALADTIVCLFPRDLFSSFSARHPAFERALLERAFADLERARAFIRLLGRKSAGQRVATLLLEMASRAAEIRAPNVEFLDPRLRFDMPLRRRDIADLLGLTIETVSRQFTRLSDDGIIELPDRRSVVLKGPERLAARAAA